MFHPRSLLVFTAALFLQPLLGAGSSDPLFATVPFSQWFDKASQTRFKWSERMLPTTLSVHQRLLAHLEVTLDGVELERRRGKGHMLILCQFTDAQGGVWQDHGSIDLEKVEAGARGSDITFTESAFVLPGDYAVAVAIFDTAANEHAARRDKLHVPVLADDPLPAAWRNLPPIEFMPPAEPPDLWYLPAVTGRLNLPLAARTSRISLLVNLTPSEHAAGSFRVRDRNLGALIPSMKAVSQIDTGGVPLDVSLIDLTRRVVSFRQDNAQPLDWSRMRDALAEANPGSVDVRALEDRQHNAAFFAAEVGRLLAPSRALIILSSPVEFASGQDLQPSRAALPRNCEVFYVRYQPITQPPNITIPTGTMYGVRQVGGMPPGMRPRLSLGIVDQLAGTLKPLSPRLFDVHTPFEFRKALAAIMAELADR